MIYLEELIDAVISEEGQTLMGLDFLIEALNLPMKNLELIFRKAVGEYSERRPMKKTEVIGSFEYTDGVSGYIKMPEGTTSCRVARYGIMPNQMPRFYIDKFSEKNVEFDPITLTCRVWPPVLPMRLTYTARYTTTKSVLIESLHEVPYEVDETDFVLETMYGGKSLLLQRAVDIIDEETGEKTQEMQTMTPTGIIQEIDNFGEPAKVALLAGSLGEGYVDLKTREVHLEMSGSSTSPILATYYPKYLVAKDLELSDYMFTKLFASKLLVSLASLRAQATQAKVHQIDLTSDSLYERAQDLKKEVHDLLKSTISFGDMAPM